MLILRLFFSFLQVGLFSVGGGYAAIPLIQHQVVDTLHLMTMSEFADLVTIAEMTPGPVTINSATFVGTKLAGLPGAIICTVGAIIPSFIICLSLAYFYYKYRNFKGVQTILGALRPAVVALISSAGLSILTLAIFQAERGHIVISNFHFMEASLFAVGLFALRKWKVSPIAVIFGSGFIGTLFYLIF